MKISFQFAEKTYSIKFRRKRKAWINDSVIKEKGRVESINFIFCSDEFLLKINQKFLMHDFYTDVITFSDNSKYGLNGEIYISVERVRENSDIFKVDFDNELNRVLIHSVLHLLGYKDKSNSQKKIMTQKEDYYLRKF